jgi:hypothetical protein
MHGVTSLNASTQRRWLSSREKNKLPLLRFIVPNNNEMFKGQISSFSPAGVAAALYSRPTLFSSPLYNLMT